MKPFRISCLDKTTGIVYETIAHPELGPTNGVRAWLEVDRGCGIPDDVLMELAAAANAKIKSLLAAPVFKQEAPIELDLPSMEELDDLFEDAEPNETLVEAFANYKRLMEDY